MLLLHVVCFLVAQKVEAKATGAKHAPAERKATGEKDKIKVDSKDLTFWVLMESVLLDVMSAAEAAVVIGKMKKVM